MKAPSHRRLGHPTFPSGLSYGTTSTQTITRLDLEKSVSCLADFVLSSILADETLEGKEAAVGKIRW